MPPFSTAACGEFRQANGVAPKLLKGMDIETLRNIHQIVKDMAHG